MSSRPVLVIGNRNYSSWSLRPWLLLRHFGVDFEERRLPLDTPVFRDDIEALSPSGRVPALHHDGLIVWDSLAICEYANEAWLAGGGWPADRAARAVARSVCAEMHSGFADLRSECPMNVRRRLAQPLALSDGARRDAGRIAAIWRETRAAYGSAGDCLFGGFSIADAFFAPVVLRFLTYGIALGEVERRYLDAMLGLPATRDWIDAAGGETERIDKYERIGADAA